MKTGSARINAPYAQRMARFFCAFMRCCTKHRTKYGNSTASASWHACTVQKHRGGGCVLALSRSADRGCSLLATAVGMVLGCAVDGHLLVLFGKVDIGATAWRP